MVRQIGQLPLCVARPGSGVSRATTGAQDEKRRI